MSGVMHPSRFGLRGAPALWLVAATCLAALGPGCGDEASDPLQDGGISGSSSGKPGTSSGEPGTGSSSSGSSGTSSGDLPDAEPDSPYTVTTESVQAAGITHEYVLVIPKERATATLPIVLAYHGDVGTGDQLRTGWHVEAASGNAAIVVYPNQPGGWEVTNQSSGNPFLAGFDAIVAKVAAEHAGDAADVSAVGWSNGGFFTQILGCWRGAKLRAIGAMAGSYPYDSTSTGGQFPNTFPKCEGEVPVAAIIMHGANDGVGNGALSAVYWTYVNKCSAAPDGCSANTEARSPGFREPCVRFDDAPAASPVHLCELPGFGHSIWDQSAAAMWEFSRAVP